MSILGHLAKFFFLIINLRKKNKCYDNCLSMEIQKNYSMIIAAHL